MKNTLFTLLACIVMMFGFSTHTFAADFPEQACSNFTVNGTQPDNINSCDQCFDGGFVYEDKGMTLTDAYVNNNSDDHIFYIDENPSVYEYKTLQSSSVWATGPSTKMLEPTSNMVLQTGRSGRDYFRFKPGRTNFLQTIPGNGVKLLSVGTGTIRNNPAYRFVFDLNSRLFDGVSAPQALVNHRECVFFKAARCGDGVVDTDQGETCDSGALNGTGVGCSATCQTVPMTNYDLALTKRVVGSDTSFAPGETVEYNITVHNQGNQPANGIVISDYVPAGLTIIDPNWTVVGGTGTRTITGPILPGNTASVVLRARVESSFTGSQIVNWAEISVDDGDDVDSTPDQSNVNDCHGGDGGSGTGIGNIDQDADNNILSTGNTTLHSGDQDGDGICEQGEDEDDHDPALISIIQSRISIDKTDANPADRDGVQGDDRQTVLVGSGAIFQITVRNDSAETLTGVVITDALEPLCNQTAAQTANLISTQIAGGVFAAGTSFTYSCTDAVVPATYTNNAAVTAQGVTSGNTVTDDDNSQVFAISSALTFTKTDLNPADRDGVQRNDTQTVMTGATAIFEITVENTGTQPITGFSIIDANTPNCAATPTLSGSSIGNTGAWTNVTASGVVNGELVQSGRISFTCTQPSVSGDFTNTAIINATTSVGPLSSTDDSVVRVETYDLALTKTVSGSTNVFTRGDSVTFNVVVENQGTIAANNITVIDYIPTGLTLNDTAWTLNGNRATRVISTSIAAGANVVLPITFTVDSTATGLLQNWAEISVDDGPDTDSTPDSTLVNDCHGITDFTSIPVSALDAAANNRTDGRGDANGNGICEAGEDEDDHDVEQINILIPSVSIVKTDSNVDDLDRGVVDTQLVHAGSGATFRITLTNDGSDNLTNIEVVDALGASCAGPVALSGTGVSTPGTWTGVTFSGIVGGQLVPNGTLSYNCTVDNTTVAYTNTGTVTASGALTTRSVTASDGSDVVLAPIAGITVDKVDANVNDLDGGVADSQTVFAGSGATFGITVTNSGTDSLTNITLSDQLGVACQGPVTLTGTTIIGQPGWSNLTATGIVNGQLSPTGSFSYNCTVPATASGYINSISVAASGAISLRDASDTDTSAVVLAPVQAISINKVDANPADLDGGVVDSQMVASGSVATFGITVTNTGTDSLRNIVLSDALANNCAGNVTLSGSTLTGETTWLNLTSTGVVNGLLTPSGSFSYTCNGPITASGYTNEAIVTASGAITNRLATARDTSVVVLAPAPGILVTKTDANPADTDGTIGDDTQTVASGAVATFGITVTNTGTENLRNIVLADALGANCSGTPTLSGSTLTGETTWSNLTSTGIVNGELTQSGSFSYTCNGPATSTGYTNEIIVTASGVTSGASLSVADQSAVVLATAPVATCDSLTATPILGAPGFTSALTCSATNATSYQINCGNGTTINSSTGSCTYTTPQTFVASCTINGSITAPTCQQAIDSVPPAAVTQVVAISKTDANPADTDGTIGNDTQTITSGGTATFRITVTNNGTETLRNFTVADPLGTTCAGSATLSGATVLGATGWSNITSTGVVNGSLIPTGNFSYECSTAGITASYTNTASVSAFGASTNSGTSLSDSSAVVVTTGGGGPGPTGGGLGGSTRLACENMVFNVSALNADNIEIHNDRFLTFSGATVTVPVECQGNVKVNYFKVDCGNGVITGSKRVEPDTHNQTFECIYNKRASEPTYFPKCLASNTSDENFRGNAVQCSGKVTLGAGFCGDGQVQSGEQCDLGSENGTICTNSCKLDLNVNLSTQPGVKTPGVITLPRGGKILITPNSGSKVIGNGQSVFDIGEIAEVKNESEHEINLEGEELCVSSSNSRLVSGGQRCSSSIKWLYPGHTQKVILEDKFIGKTSGIANGKRYQDTEVITTLGDLRTAFFAGTTKVRVTKPSISTVGGGTSLIKDTSGITKLDDVVEGNTNFEGAGVGTDGFGSTTNVTGDNVDTIGTSDGINLDIIDTSEATTQFTNYNGIDNVFIIKGTDTTIGSDFLDDASGARTYIIEDADLIIDGNIDYSSNIAFVVRGGDIRVKDSVTQIDGTYIAIKKNNTGGSISSDKTSNQLVVDGSLYGDISELVDNRTYVKQNGDGQLDVGTIISFASNLFRKPAPLVGKFINEYTSSEKTAE